jgi:tRNA pseudouridine38-40 synthase
MPTQRLKLTIAYRGTHYHGWQRQVATMTWKKNRPPPGMGIPTIQETLARAIGGVVGHPVSVVGSSRTDARVHAKGQVAHFDTTRTQIPPRGLMRAVNHQLPPDILIRKIEPVGDDFDAIMSTECKRYQYAIWSDEMRNPFVHDLLWHRWRPLDVAVMSAAAAHFVGTHNFTSFARPGHERGSSVRTVLACDISRRGPLLVIGVLGTGFLWNMIRIMVGTLCEIGLGLYEADDIPKMLAARDRRAAGSTAPPEGLYLQWVKFREQGSPNSDSITKI